MKLRNLIFILVVVFFCFSKKKKEIKSTKCYYNFYDFTSDPTCLLAETSATLHVLP